MIRQDVEKQTGLIALMLKKASPCTETATIYQFGLKSTEVPFNGLIFSLSDPKSENGFQLIALHALTAVQHGY